MAYRRAANLCLWIARLEKSPKVFSHTVRFHEHAANNHYGTTARSLHTGTAVMVAKLLSVDELFANRSLQDYLKKMETEHSDCLRAVNSHVNEEEVKAKRSKVSQRAPLIQSIRELDTKQKDIAETEMLLKDEALREVAEMERDSRFQDIQDLSGKVFDMYQGYSILELMTSKLGGLRHTSASVGGPQSYKRMKFEGGVHRVQRVPKTEKLGRMHTSTVAVLPQPSECDKSTQSCTCPDGQGSGGVLSQPNTLLPVHQEVGNPPTERSGYGKMGELGVEELWHYCVEWLN